MVIEYERYEMVRYKACPSLINDEIVNRKIIQIAIKFLCLSRKREKKARKKNYNFYLFFKHNKKEFSRKRKAKNENEVMNNLQCKFSTQINSCSLRELQMKVRDGGNLFYCFDF